MLTNPLMAMVFVAQESTNAAAKEAGAFLMVALVALGGAAILAILVLIIMARRLRKRKTSPDWRLDWKSEQEGDQTDAWKEAAERVSGEEFEEEDDEGMGDR